MRVKIGDTVYDAEIEPIMLILTPQDKLNIENMLPEATMFCIFPDNIDTKEIKKFMKIEPTESRILTFRERCKIADYTPFNINNLIGNLGRGNQSYILQEEFEEFHNKIMDGLGIPRYTKDWKGIQFLGEVDNVKIYYDKYHPEQTLTVELNKNKTEMVYIISPYDDIAIFDGIRKNIIVSEKPVTLEKRIKL